MGAEGIEPSNGGLRIRCPAIRRRTRSAGSLYRPEPAASFSWLPLFGFQRLQSVRPGGIEPPWSNDVRVTAGPVSIAVYDLIRGRAVDGIRTRESDLASRRFALAPGLRPARAHLKHFDRITRAHESRSIRYRLPDIESSCARTSSPRRELHPNRRLTRALLCLLSYEGKRGPPRNRTSPRPFWRRSDAQHPRPRFRRSPHLCVFRAMFVRTSPRSPSLSAFGRLGLTSSLKMKEAGNLSVPGLLKVPLGICSKSRV